VWARRHRPTIDSARAAYDSREDGEDLG
jgi:hypothetical protein